MKDVRKPKRKKKGKKKKSRTSREKPLLIENRNGVDKQHNGREDVSQ